MAKCLIESSLLLIPVLTIAETLGATMKNLIVILTFITLILSCADKNDKELVCATKDEIVEEREPEHYEYRDSIYAQNVWYTCQVLINSNKQKDYFLGHTDTTQFENNGSSEIYGTVEITSDFNPKRKYARIKRISTNGYTYIDIVDLTNDSALIREKHWWGNYVGDTIIDCNKDGFNDYVLKVMASSGCCPREDSWIYLYNPKINDFEKPIDFLNVSYFTDRRELVGMSYGQPKETYLYRIRFNNLIVDTLGFLHHHPEDSTKFVLSKTNHVNLKKDKILNYVPSEYKKSNGYSWFISE